MKLSTSFCARGGLILAAVVGSALLISSPGPVFTEKDKAFYLDANQANFIRPGLLIEITSADIGADGTITTRFKLTDPRGQALDRTGVATPGNVSVSFIAAHIPADQKQYVSYTTRVQNSTITGRSAVQAAGENNGTFAALGDGLYQYTFRTKAPANLDRTASHRIGAYGSRNLSEFDLGTQFDDDTFDFIPAGGTVTKTRDLVQTATCNNCHDQMAFHGGSRRTMELCVMCHTPQTTDPDTGNTVDMVAMTHRIHMGANLPSVQAGGKYEIIGNAQSVHDYSGINFPADARNCQVCHVERDSPQANNWLVPTRSSCGSCHDNINFATGEGHLNLPQVSDNQCGNCHTPHGELEFDASIIGAHQIPRASKMLPGVVFNLLAVANGSAGNRPTVTFSIKDKAGLPIAASSMDTFRLYFAGSTSEYSQYFAEDARRAECNTDGVCTYTFTRAIPADAKGTFTAYVEGYRNIRLLEGTAKEMVQRDAGQNRVLDFSVDGSPVVPRRTVVAAAKCNACHSSIAFHGEQRNTIEACVICHNPTATDALRRPAGQMPAQTIDFKTMIHRLHTGHELEHEYTVYGFGNVPHDFTRFGYPGDRRNCNACHVNNSQQLPMPAGALPVADPRGLLNPMGPETAACTSCHSSRAAKAHALVNSTAIGESCAACHGVNSEFSVDRSHAR